MPRADLHVHSRYSDHPSEWFLQRLGTAESYTDPETVYQQAKARGMDFVALTDHNCITGALELAERHPDVIVGSEFTTYFPGDGCKVHLLVWGLNEAQFDVLQEIRTDIHRVRDYVRDQGLAHSVAHATFAVNDRLTSDHLEQLVLLFDVFEVVNGGRTCQQNTQWRLMLEHLTPAMMAQLSHKHRIEPFSDRSWVKGMTGGSDDHAGLLIGQAWTEVPDAESPAAFLTAVKDRRSSGQGRHNDYRTLAFAVYKTAVEFSRTRTDGRVKGSGPVDSLNSLLFGVPFEGEPFPALRRRIGKLRGSSDPLVAAFMRLLDDLEAAQDRSLDERLDLAHERISDVADELVAALFDSISSDLQTGDVVSVVRNLSAALPAVFLAAPFFTTAHALGRGREAAEAFREANGLPGRSTRGTLWLTDTYGDLNGVSVTLGQVVSYLERHPEVPLRVATSLGDSGPAGPCLLDLPSVHRFNLPYYESYTLSVPSLMKTLKLIAQSSVDTIVVSTPGPVGLAGVLCAKVLGLPLKAVFHTDFTAQAFGVTRDESLADMVDAYQNWFYGLADEILVPTESYVRILLERGFDERRLRPFRHGVDADVFRPSDESRGSVRSRLDLGDGPMLLFVGRLSRDKNLDLLCDAYRLLLSRHSDAGLVFVGDGPYAEEITRRTADLPGVRLIGRIENADLPLYYSAADYLVFPSTTDTFGMAVLEAQACGLPALVSAIGGPQDVVADGVTGVIVRADDPQGWAEAMADAVEALLAHPGEHDLMRIAARERALRHSWESMLDDVVGFRDGGVRAMRRGWFRPSTATGGLSRAASLSPDATSV